MRLGGILIQMTQHRWQKVPSKLSFVIHSPSVINQMEYNKRLGLFRKNRPKTPAVLARSDKPKPKRLQSAKQRVMESLPTDDNKHHKLFDKIKIKSIKQFNTDNCGEVKDYEFHHKIGRGAYAVVRLATHNLTGDKRAVKFYDRSKLVDGMRKQSLHKEIRILSRVEHPNIIKLYEAIDTSKYVYLSTEFVAGPSLLKHLKSKSDRMLCEAEVKSLWGQLIKAISYLHSKNVTHRDVKLENILLTED